MLPAPKVSIIIPLHIISPRFYQDFKKFDLLKYSDFEVIIVSDQKAKIPKLQKAPVRFILTHQKSTGPAEKRDIALRFVKGQLCAFIDDDAYPHPKWLKRAVRWFVNPDVIAVGGPGVTPPEDNFWEKIGGYIIESYLCSGGIQYRFYVNDNTPPAFVDDWPAYNLVIRSRSLKKVGGFASTFYGGEDTYVCLRLDKIGKMVFEPRAIVYHHRRAFPLAHLKQIRSVGIHRGYFFKTYPETSRRPLYLMPTLLTLGLGGGIFLAATKPQIYLVSLITASVFALVLTSVSVNRHRISWVESAIAGFGIILTHVCYGIYFVQGLFTKELKR